MSDFTDADFEAVAGQDGLSDYEDIELNPLRITKADLETSGRETAIVELCINTGGSHIVGSSDKPFLTHDIIFSKGARLHKEKVVWDGKVLDVTLTHGIPQRVLFEQLELMESYEHQDSEDPAVREQLYSEYRCLLLSKSFRDPVFSFRGEPPEGVALDDCFPIEKCPPNLSDELWRCHQNLHNKTENDWYQVEVLRATPLDLSLIGKGFDAYPVGGERSRIIDMPDEERENHFERTELNTRVHVASTILNPSLSVDGKGHEGAYPVEKISFFFIQMLYNAHKLVNAPDSVHEMLRDFHGLGQTELGRSQFLFIGRMSRDYGTRPSEFIRGDPIDLSLDSIVSKVVWDEEALQLEQQKQQRSHRS